MCTAAGSPLPPHPNAAKVDKHFPLPASHHQPHDIRNSQRTVPPTGMSHMCKLQRRPYKVSATAPDITLTALIRHYNYVYAMHSTHFHVFVMHNLTCIILLITMHNYHTIKQRFFSKLSVSCNKLLQSSVLSQSIMKPTISDTLLLYKGIYTVLISITNYQLFYK